MSVDDYATPDHQPRRGEAGHGPDAVVATRRTPAGWVVALVLAAGVMALVLPALADALHAQRSLTQDTSLPLASADLTIPAGWSIDPASIGPVEVAVERDGVAVDVVSGTWQGMTGALLERLESLYLGGESLVWHPDGHGSLDDMLESPRAVWRTETAAGGATARVAVLRQSASVTLVVASAQEGADVSEDQVLAALETIVAGLVPFEPGVALGDASQGAQR